MGTSAGVSPSPALIAPPRSAGTHDAVNRDEVEAAAAVAGDADRALDLARDIGWRLPRPGSGRTGERWLRLRGIAAADLTAARVLEAHADALAILAEAADDQDDEPGIVNGDNHRLWGVFAAEGPGVRLEAEPAGDGWVLRGTKPWCSLAGRLDRALVTAHVGSTGRRLFAIDLTDRRVQVEPADGWVARGLVEVPSTSIRLDGCPARPVGPVGWYLDRPGFAWGGIGVAACWLGGAIGIGRTLRAAWRDREPDQLALAHLGAVDSALFAADAALGAAADAVDSGRAQGPDGALWAARVRSVVADTVEAVLVRAGHALGPAPLAFDPTHARRVADLELYVRQHHAERDAARLGAQLRELPAWW
jgi:alkylation response protein AidB-like acyl-CoA dehydrogenase